MVNVDIDEKNYMIRYYSCLLTFFSLVKENRLKNKSSLQLQLDYIKIYIVFLIYFSKVLELIEN